MKKIVTLFFLLAIHISTFAGNGGNNVMQLNGNVIDKSTHETLAGVKVHVIGTNIIVYTDFDGNFFLPDLPSASYELEFDYITYKTSLFVSDPNTPGCNFCPTLSVEIQQN